MIEIQQTTDSAQCINNVLVHFTLAPDLPCQLSGELLLRIVITGRCSGDV